MGWLQLFLVFAFFSIFTLNEVQTRYLVGPDFSLAFFQYSCWSTNGTSSYLVRPDFSLVFFSIIILKYKLKFSRIQVWFHSFSICSGVFINPGQYITIINQNYFDLLIIMTIFMFWISFAESFYIPQLSPNAFSAP